MACRNIVKWPLGHKRQWNFNQNQYIFIQEYAFETVVWKMSAILSRPQCVKMSCHSYDVTWIILAHEDPYSGHSLPNLGQLTTTTELCGLSSQAIVRLNIIMGPYKFPI